MLYWFSKKAKPAPQPSGVLHGWENQSLSHPLPGSRSVTATPDHSAHSNSRSVNTTLPPSCLSSRPDDAMPGSRLIEMPTGGSCTLTTTMALGSRSLTTTATIQVGSLSFTAMPAVAVPLDDDGVQAGGISSDDDNKEHPDAPDTTTGMAYGKQTSNTKIMVLHSVSRGQHKQACRPNHKSLPVGTELMFKHEVMVQVYDHMGAVEPWDSIEKETAAHIWNSVIDMYPICPEGINGDLGLFNMVYRIICHDVNNNWLNGFVRAGLKALEDEFKSRGLTSSPDRCDATWLFRGTLMMRTLAHHLSLVTTSPSQDFDFSRKIKGMLVMAIQSVSYLATDVPMST
ncbi:hypothetical protein BDQ17DRAFT_1422805 [Cyathus striatus]|nr:hypothetical protein BDQ17DRAFT_1422805 [Cyathus striatus]